MATVAIVGASGYAGQETLDRVLAHPALELYALGSDSLAGQPASARSAARPERVEPDPAVHHERGRARGRRRRDLPLPVARGGRGARRPARGVVVDLSGRAPLPRPGRVSRVVRLRAPATGRARELVVRPSRAQRAVGAPRRESRLLRDRSAPRARADRVGDRARRVVVDAKSGMTGAGRALRVSSHAGVGARERRRRTASARTSTRRRSPLSSDFPSPSFPPPARAPRAARDVRRALARRRPARHARGALRGEPRRRRPAGGCRPELARVQQTDGAEIGVFEDRSTGDTIVICALDNLGKGAAGQAIQNVNLLFGLDETTGLRLSGVLV